MTVAFSHRKHPGVEQHNDAYVFLSDPDCPENLKVIATVASPPFFVMSYRRSCKACQTNEAMGTSRDNCDCAGVFRLNDGLLQQVLSTGTVQVDMLPMEEPETSPTSKHPVPTVVAEQEHVLRMMFAILHHSHIPTSEPSLRDLLRCFDSKTSTFFLSKAHPTSSNALMLCVNITLAVLVHGRQDIRDFMATHASDLLHQDRLWQRYELWLQLVNAKTNAALINHNMSWQLFMQSLIALAR
ncbi:hypothetical protein DYB32_007907 [Aphanomyces invadans]|uniref:Uncharacterized protein n=1 Tax=Aphanomyces invadans TaxID=157072 RepID=A0A3R6Y413_9STRA|nr:hypothetical protein DYB32_007907 [Aphanomyces invadans]